MVSFERIVKAILFGAIGAALGWLLVEPCPWMTTDTAQGAPARNVDMNALATLGAVLGMSIGAGLGFAQGSSSASVGERNRTILYTILLGAMGGLVGVYFGQTVFGYLTNLSPRGADGQPVFFVMLVARTLGWGLWGVGTGVGIGAGFGLASGSFRRFTLSAIGGALGGLLGGFLFEVLGALATTPEILRLWGFATMGIFIGLFGALAQEIFKQAWVRVLIGRNEGRVVILDKPIVTIGKSERADIPLFGDPLIIPEHAVIRSASGVYTVLAASGAVMHVNGRAVTQADLVDGDVIRLGTRELLFNTKGRARARAGAYQSGSAATGPAVSVAPGSCAYCGQAFDASGQCACSVGGQPRPEPVATPSAPPYPGVQQGIFSLSILTGPRAGGVIPVQPGRIIRVGRDPGSDIVLDDGFASRNHAEIRLDKGMVEIEDLTSSNGTYVNGVRIGTKQLNRGDIVRIGQTDFRLD